MNHSTCKTVLTAILFFAMSVMTMAQGKFVPFKYGNFDTWVTRQIHESAVIGGQTKTLYEIGPNRSLSGNNPYTNLGGSPWGTSNVMAKVSGITKTNNSVYRDNHASGHCAKMTTHIETCKVLGLINIKVLAAGSIFLGDMKEPITGTKDGPKALNFGIPFTHRPKALRYDYKVQVPGTPNRIRQTGFSKVTTVPGPDYCIAMLLLQKRHEDANGNITGKSFYNAATMGLRSHDYARNSKGKSVLVKETGWAPADATPTHIVLQFSSSHGGAYVGTVGNTFWVDNVGLVY